MTEVGALLVPIPEADRLVEEWRSQHDPAASLGIPAHVTVLYPWLAPGRVDGGVVADLAHLFGGVPAFSAEFRTLGRFDDVLHLAPADPEPFIALTDLVVERWPDYPPYAGRHPELVPHLTVAHGDAALFDWLSPMVEAGLPVATTVRRVWYMAGAERWTVRARFELAPARERPGE